MSGRRRRPGDGLRLPAAISGDIAGAAPRDMGPVRRVVEVWPDVVGEALARVAQPARVARDGTLVVHAVDASWVHAITLEARTIRRRLEERLGAAAPSDLRVEIGPISVATPLPEPVQIEILPEARTRAAEIAAGVEDDDLRATLERAIATSLSRPKTP